MQEGAQKQSHHIQDRESVRSELSMEPRFPWSLVAPRSRGDAAGSLCHTCTRTPSSASSPKSCLLLGPDEVLYLRPFVMRLFCFCFSLTFSSVHLNYHII